MDLTLTAAQQEFRAEFRDWLSKNHPGEPPAGQDEAFAWRRDFQRLLDRDGWAGVHWPTEYGGRGASVMETSLFFEELGRARAPLPANILGLALAGPTLMEWGTPEQKRRHLPAILSAEEIFCQCFSEPSAGSDLASVATFATKVDGGWRVSGQKVWTSFAQYAKWGLLLARTDRSLAKHAGLTFFIVDMQQPGVEARPLRQITEDAEFNEVFFDEAFVPDQNLVGAVGGGWAVTMTTLMNERSGVVTFLQTQVRNTMEDLRREAQARGLDQDSAVRDRLASLLAQTEILRLTNLRGLSAIDLTGRPGPESSLVKWMWATVNQDLTTFAVNLLGVDALAAGSPWSHEVLRARGNSIEGGTSDIQQNIIAERVLGLPRGA